MIPNFHLNSHSLLSMLPRLETRCLLTKRVTLKLFLIKPSVSDLMVGMHKCVSVCRWETEGASLWVLEWGWYNVASTWAWFSPPLLLACLSITPSSCSFNSYEPLHFFDQLMDWCYGCTNGCDLWASDLKRLDLFGCPFGTSFGSSGRNSWSKSSSWKFQLPCYASCSLIHIYLW